MEEKFNKMFEECYKEIQKTIMTDGKKEIFKGHIAKTDVYQIINKLKQKVLKKIKGLEKENFNKLMVVGNKFSKYFKRCEQLEKKLEEKDEKIVELDFDLRCTVDTLKTEEKNHDKINLRLVEENKKLKEQIRRLHEERLKK